MKAKNKGDNTWNFNLISVHLLSISKETYLPIFILTHINYFQKASDASLCAYTQKLLR